MLDPDITPPITVEALSTAELKQRAVRIVKGAEEAPTAGIIYAVQRAREMKEQGDRDLAQAKELADEAEVLRMNAIKCQGAMDAYLVDIQRQLQLDDESKQKS